MIRLPRTLRKARPLAALALGASLVAPVGARGQSLPSSVGRDSLVVRADALEAGAPPGLALRAGERIAVWTAADVEVGRPGAGGRPVPDAPPGAVVARFDGGPWFAWSEGPTVWTAPASGRLEFTLNAGPRTALSGRARLALVRLGTVAAPAPAVAAFPAPRVELERAGDGVRVRYADRAGFGLVRSTLELTLHTAHGETIHLAAWRPVGRRETLLPLPPPDVPLPPGVQTLDATITDWLGNESPASRVVFDAAQ